MVYTDYTETHIFRIMHGAFDALFVLPLIGSHGYQSSTDLM